MTDKLEQAIIALNAATKVNIKGRGYSTVATRVEIFRRHFGHAYSLETEIIDAPDPLVRMKATIRFDDSAGQPYVVATGFAEEDRTQGPINKTSALENAETSAIGRALAAFGLHGGEYASAGEVSNAIAQQTNDAGGPVTQSSRTKNADGKTVPNPNWTGPLNKTQMHAEFSALVGRLGECRTLDEVDALEDEYGAVIHQMKADLPDWWDWDRPDSDVKGLTQQINSTKHALAALREA